MLDKILRLLVLVLLVLVLVAHGAGWGPYGLREALWHTLRGLDLYYADPAPPLTTAGEELDSLDRDLSFRGVQDCPAHHY